MKRIYLRNNVSPPTVMIGGKRYRFRSLLELRFGLFLEYLVWAEALGSWQYEATRYRFPGRTRRPHEYTPDFTVHNLDGTVTIYETMAWLTTAYLSKFRLLKAQCPDYEIVAVMARTDSNKARREIYRRAVDKGLVSHIWYVGRDFRRGGIIAKAQELIDASSPE